MNEYDYRAELIEVAKALGLAQQIPPEGSAHEDIQKWCDVVIERATILESRTKKH